MQAIESLFNSKVLARELRHFDITTIPDLQAKRRELTRWKYSIENSYLDKTKETSIQGTFLERLWGSVLGYSSILFIIFTILLPKKFLS